MKLIPSDNNGLFNFTFDDNNRKAIFFKGQPVEADVSEVHCSVHAAFSSGCFDCMMIAYIKTFDAQQIEKGESTGTLTFTSADTDKDFVFVKSQTVVKNIEEGHCSKHQFWMNGCDDCLIADYTKAFDEGEFDKVAKLLGNTTSAEIQIANPNPKFQLVRQQLARALAVFFAKQKRRAANAAYSKTQELKKTLTKEQQAVIAYAAYQAIQWELLVGTVYVDLMAAWQMGAAEGFNQFPGSYDVMNGLPKDMDESAPYAFDRAAEMVGMAQIGKKLVPSSNAKFVIANTTKNDLEDTVEQSFDKNESMDQMYERIIAAATFSDVRSQFIAKNEIAMAQVRGHLAAWEYLGLAKVGIRLSDSHVVEDECDLLANNGPYEIGKVPMIPAHPNCQCTIYSIGE